MKRTGVGHIYEVLMAFFILCLVLGYTLTDDINNFKIFPPIFLLLGAGLSLWGMVERRAIGLSGGIIMITIALMIQTVVYG